MSTIARVARGFARLLVFAIGARALAAQELRGVVRDSASTQPIPGAVIILLNDGSGVVGRTITNERGEYRIATSPQTQRIRVVRIGFPPVERPIPAATTGVTRFDIVMRLLPTMLEPVRVRAGANCPRRSDAEATFALLEQARAGLLATVVARDANPATLVRLRYERTYDGDHISSQSVRIDSSTGNAKSFNAVHSATDFVRLGFMSDSGGTQVFYGPDAEVLLDEEFRVGYCFRIADSDRARANQIGLSFVAASRQRGRVDIEGTLWVDTVARALRDIEYRYLGLHRRVDALRPGGRIFFREMENGVVLIDRWSLRLATAEHEVVYVNSRETTREWFRATESGGELAHATWPTGYAWHAKLGTLSGVARRPDGTPAAGTVLHLANTPYRAVADVAGSFEISDLVPGPYAITITDQRLAPIGVEIPIRDTVVAIRDSTVRRDLSIRSANDFVVDRCVFDRRFSPSDSVLLIGRVVTPGGTPVAGAVVTLRQGVAPDIRRFPGSYRAGGDGLFQFCGRGLQRDMTITVEAFREGQLLGTATQRLTDNLMVFRLVVIPKR